ncbi:hypothetical protein [Tardiphaga robiniae]|uniref:hypothetical protein n=1 Tax=Tardiphaga robiniae TaxID=943830 RepID=UPI001586B800|nr:hypothetical protein [Tardiphaga robiniae]NUU41400.1 hypothetical protein [Tardiphaga robiniae]
MTDEIRPPAEPGRYYFAKRVGWHWEVWHRRIDESADPASGATEWRTSYVKFWRWINAERVASACWSSFNDGYWIADRDHIAASEWAAEQLTSTQRPEETK